MNTHSIRWFAALTLGFAGVCLAGHSSAQAPAGAVVPPVVPNIPNSATAPQPAPAQPANEPVSAPDYILGQGDRLSIRVFGADDWPDRPIDVSAEGDIVAPLVGRVSVQGMSVRDLEAELTKQYAKFFKNPEVSVTVTDFRSQPVTVVGSVNTPGVVQLRRPTRLMEVISQAGGLKADAGDKIIVSRRVPGSTSLTNPGQPRYENQEFDLHKIIDGQDPAANVLVQANDLITVPKARMVYVVGEIGRPGGYVLDGHGGTISVLQVLALAGGTTRTARTGDSRILRPADDNSTKRTEEKIDLKKILSNKAPDVQLRADDILFVPNSAAKSAGLRTLEMAANITTGLAVWRF